MADDWTGTARWCDLASFDYGITLQLARAEELRVPVQIDLNARQRARVTFIRTQGFVGFHPRLASGARVSLAVISSIMAVYPTENDLLIRAEDGETSQLFRGASFTKGQHDPIALMPGDLIIEKASGSKDQPTGRTVYLSERILDALPVPVTGASFTRFLRVNTRASQNPWYLSLAIFNRFTRQAKCYLTSIQLTGVARFQYTRFRLRTPWFPFLR